MDHREVGRHWNKIAPTWTKLLREGYDYYRDSFNAPAFLEMLPNIKELKGLDIGCGEGHNTRLLVEQGAQMSAIDISGVFLYLQTRSSRTEARSATATPALWSCHFQRGSFDFATGFMSFMDIPETDKVLKEAFRVLKPGGFLQFSILHPCFDTPHRVKLRRPDGTTYAYEIGDYFRTLDGEVIEINKPGSPCAKVGFPSIHIPRFTQTLSQWIDLIVKAGFMIETMNEPRPSDEVVQKYPAVQDSQVLAYFLHIRGRKS
ncbi:MAG: SAM-dependent methyltransferase [Chloroflexota bacterium]|nr:MAG: SAM-dependent methyltransferase [Chloroflexota bacterium]